MTNGKRWGRTCRMRLMSRVIRSFNSALLTTRAPAILFADEAKHTSHPAEPSRPLDRRGTSDRASFRESTDDSGFRGNLSAITHDDMVGKPRLPPHAYVGSHVNGTGEPALRGYHRPRADADVVPDVNVR